MRDRRKPASRGKRVLVVDDSAELRDFVVLAVEILGHQAVAASDPTLAMEVLRVEEIDAVITDVMMQGDASGLELLTHVRSDLPPPVPPVIVCSGFPHFEEQARKRGAWTFLSKPFTLEHLQGALEGALAGHTALPEVSKRAASRSRKLRSRAAGEAEAFFRELRNSHPVFTERATWAARWASGYLGASHAAILALVDGCLRVAASSDESALPVGAKVEDRLPFCRDVLETASSLILPDASAYVNGRSKALQLRSLAAVPLTWTDGVAFGAVCVYDGRPALLDGDDLAILEVLGHRASAAARDRSVVPFFESAHVLTRETFVELLGIELRRARRGVSFVELATVALGRRQRDSSWVEAMARVTSGRRRGVAMLGGEQIGLYAAARDRPTASREVASALSDLRELLGFRGAGVVAVDGGPVPAIGERALLGVADVLADRAQKGHVERVVLRNEPWQEPRGSRSSESAASPL
jgi:CheY-like chemotaxis protein